MYKIGLVEDELDLNKLIRNYLEKEGYEVVSFTKGADVLSFIDENNEIQLWILDIMLEDDITGYEFEDLEEEIVDDTSDVIGR